MQKGIPGVDFYLGESLYGEGRDWESAAVYRRLANVKARNATVLTVNLKADSATVATVLNNWAVSLAATGDDALAETLYRLALKIQEENAGANPADTAELLNNLAHLLYSEEDYKEAEPLYRDALALREKALGPDDLDTATSMNNLTGLLLTKGDYAGAEPLLRRALAIREKVLGPDHADRRVDERSSGVVVRQRRLWSSGATVPAGVGNMRESVRSGSSVYGCNVGQSGKADAVQRKHRRSGDVVSARIGNL